MGNSNIGGLFSKWSVSGEARERTGETFNNKKQTDMAEETKKKNVMELTFIDAESMNRYVTETGKILPRKFTGLSSKEQRHIKKTVKHARNMLLMK